MAQLIIIFDIIFKQVYFGFKYLLCGFIPDNCRLCMNSKLGQFLKNTFKVLSQHYNIFKHLDCIKDVNIFFNYQVLILVYIYLQLCFKFIVIKESNKVNFYKVDLKCI